MGRKYIIPSVRYLLSVALVAPIALAVAQDAVPSKRPRPFLRGTCLSLHDEDADRDYAEEVAAIDSRLNSSHVAVAFHLWQKDVESKAPARGDKTPSDEALRRVLRQARQRGLKTVLMPIVLLEESKPGEWRGKLRPPDARAWLEAYRALLVAYAKLAQEEKVAIFCVGSELSWTQKDDLWRTIIKDVRGVFTGELLYGANWDDYAAVPFWDALDHVGLSGYYELAKAPGAEVATLRAAWDRHRDAILAWRKTSAPTKSIVFTELGYPSRTSAAVRPWQHTNEAIVDTEEQRRCYEAFVGSWAKVNELAGVFFYEWWGDGGLEDADYTPKDKPAEGVIRRFFADIRVIERRS